MGGLVGGYNGTKLTDCLSGILKHVCACTGAGYLKCGVYVYDNMANRAPGGPGLD